MDGLLSRYVQGDYSGNYGHNNIYGPSITNNYYNYAEGKKHEKYTEILQHLYPPGSDYDEHKNRVPKPAEGTCTWVTDHAKYKEWLEDKTSGLLWLSADPGCGKSVIASFLVGHLKTQTTAIVCYFFFKDDSGDQRSTTFALRALLHQLFVQRPDLCSFAEEAFNVKGSRFVHSVGTLWDILVRATAEGGCGDVICVVDALDECDEMTINTLIGRITSLQESQPSNIPLKFLVTSRPYQRIEIKLGSSETTIRLQGEEEVDSTTADVRRVINAGIKKLESYWKRPGGLAYLRDLLESSADGTFLWVSLVLESLEDCQDDSPERFTNIVNTAPRDLAQFYTSILNKSQEPDNARRILNIVVAAARPLTLQEMHIAFRIRRHHTIMKDLGGLSPEFGRIVKNLCGLFVRVIDEKIYLVHQTAREFLIKGSSTGQGNWQHTFCSRDSNFVMAEACISYLAIEDFGNDTLPGDSGSLDFQQAQIDHVREHVLHDYAAQHWPDHFRYSQGRQEELCELTRRICERGSKRCQKWLEVVWVNDKESRYHLDPSPEDFTHLMIASWLGQEVVLEWILESGEELNDKCKEYGTALNIAALREHEKIAKMLVGRNAIAYISGKAFNIRNAKRSELEEEEKLLQELERQMMEEFREEQQDGEREQHEFEQQFMQEGFQGFGGQMPQPRRMGEQERQQRERRFQRQMRRMREEQRQRDRQMRRRQFQQQRHFQVINFLKPFSIQDTHDPHSFPGSSTTSPS